MIFTEYPFSAKYTFLVVIAKLCYFRMSLGKVDELGRFVSELDPQPVLDKAKANSMYSH